MNVWSWKKNKIITSGWFYYYDSDERGYVFASDDLTIKEDLAKKMSLNLMDALRLYNTDNISYKLLLESLAEEERLNGLNFVEIQYVRSIIEGVRKQKDMGEGV